MNKYIKQKENTVDDFNKNQESKLNPSNLTDLNLITKINISTINEPRQPIEQGLPFCKIPRYPADCAQKEPAVCQVTTVIDYVSFH